MFGFNGASQSFAGGLPSAPTESIAPREVFCVQARSKVAMHSQRLCKPFLRRSINAKDERPIKRRKRRKTLFRFPYKHKKNPRSFRNGGLNFAGVGFEPTTFSL